MVLVAPDAPGYGEDGATGLAGTPDTGVPGVAVHDRSAAVKLLQRGDLGPDTPAAADRVREILQGWALPQG